MKIKREKKLNNKKRKKEKTMKNIKVKRKTIKNKTYFLEPPSS